MKLFYSKERFKTFSEILCSENNWTMKFTQEVISEYEKFINLIMIDGHYSNPTESLSSPQSDFVSRFMPGETILKVWELHILFTSDYYKMCKIYFGKFIHYSKDKEDQCRLELFELYFRTYNTKVNYIWKTNKTKTPWPFFNSYSPGWDSYEGYGIEYIFTEEMIEFLQYNSILDGDTFQELEVEEPILQDTFQEPVVEDISREVEEPIFHGAFQEPEVQEPEVQEPEVQEPEVQEPEVQEPDED